MKTSLLLSAGLALAAPLLAQTTFNGNGNSGFGGVLGLGSLELDDDGSTVTATLASGNTGAFAGDNAVAIYLDTRPGGLGSTATITDDADPGRRAISGNGGGQSSTITFAAGFEADFAIAIEPNFAGVFEIEPSGALTFVTSADLVANDPTFTFDFDFDDIGGATSFDFVATYLNQTNAFRSDEAIGTPLPSGNVGQSPVAFTAFASYSAAVPVSLASFDAATVGAGVELTWATASEQDNAGFAVERSRDGSTWTEIAFVAGFGESRTLRDYRFRDGDAGAGTRYYRLKQVDFDGLSTYSPVVTVGGAAALAHDFALEGATPVRTATTVRNLGAEARAFEVYAQTGQRVAGFELGAGEAYRLDVADFAAGIYLVRSGGAIERFVKQ